jgi:RND family efflux transporter MFP subunit
MPSARRYHATIFAILCLFGGAGAPVFAEEWIDCRMDPEAELLLGFGDAGLIAELMVRAGERVNAGAPLARQRDELERIRRDLLVTRLASGASVAAQEARIALMLSKLERARTLAARNVGSDAQLEELEYEHQLAEIGLEQALADRKVSEMELDLAEAQLERKQLSAPVDGIVLELFRKPGEYAERSDPVVKLGVLDPLRIRAFPDVALFGAVATGDPVLIRPFPPFEGEFEAHVTNVSPQVDPASRTFTVEAELPNPNIRLPAGQRCVVSF